MSPEDKQSRLKELSNPNVVLSDQEYEEKERLEDELNIIQKEETNTLQQVDVNLGNGKGFTIPVKKQKRRLIDIVLNKLKKKPITFEQIEKLKNERTVAYLKRDIAKANYERKNPGGKPRPSKSSSKNNEIEKEFRSSPRDFRSMSGSNDKNKYKDLIGWTIYNLLL